MAAAVMVSLATVWVWSTKYVPVRPSPVPSCVMCVPAVTPTPASVWPTARVPDATALTVSVP
ncbi:MAG: hypothetical protein E5Y43_04470 [Mesorhizobium sp.]|nr:MAG: hypothetical protein E5Y43_04470 [Mesorhizobium sp.]